LASSRREAFLRASLLDRLMQPPGSGRVGSPLEVGVRELRDAVARDLDWLLNSRRYLDSNVEGLKEVKASLMNYGMPDLSLSSWQSGRDLASAARTIEEQIRLFEPRLRPGSVRVTPPSEKDVMDGRPNFRIDAILQVEPVNEPVSFDTDVDVDARRISVRGDR
jgi:type VI secretion system protein ImpF